MSIRMVIMAGDRALDVYRSQIGRYVQVEAHTS